MSSVGIAAVDAAHLDVRTALLVLTSARTARREQGEGQGPEDRA